MEKEMDEGRKRTLGVIAAIFACRNLSALDGKPSPAREMAFRDSIDLAAEMMRRIDARWPNGEKVRGIDSVTPTGELHEERRGGVCVVDVCWSEDKCRRRLPQGKSENQRGNATEFFVVRCHPAVCT